MPQSRGEVMVDFPLLNCVSSLFSVPVKDSCQKPACYEKTVTLTKEPYDSLGMTVAGGMSSRGWDLPIYVTNVDSDGVVGQEGSIRKGNKQQNSPGCLFPLLTCVHSFMLPKLSLPHFYHWDRHGEGSRTNSVWSVCLCEAVVCSH